MHKSILICAFFAIIGINDVSSTQESFESFNIHQLFTMMITPDLFNFTSQTYNEQFRYRLSILGKPSLPSFMNFQFSKDRNLGYLYGSATENYADREIKIEIVALNKLTYETRRIIIPMRFNYKSPPINKIEMKITNYNWVHLTDQGRINNLKGIFAELWTNSTKDLNIIFMDSAVRMGARLPLQPSNREGVIVHIGSNIPLSKKLIELEEEIKPLSKLTTCTFKRTKVQQIFQNAGFTIDWCAFKIISPEDATMSTTYETTTQSEKSNIWNGISKDELPDRNYSEEFAIAVAVPSVIFAFIVALLTIVLCFQHEKLHDEKSIKYIQDLFEICTRKKKPSEQPKTRNFKSPVQMVQYSGSNNNPPKTTLKSLHDPYSDNLSLDSDSPSTNIFQEGSPKLNAYYRPNPPAYTGKITFQGPSTSNVRFESNDI